jgi:serine/threonine protein kinase
MAATGAENASEDARRATANARVGTTLHGKWHLDELLGLGGMAAVYAATHRNGIRGAVKVLDPVFGQNPAVRERFLREGYLANSVDHPAAVLVLDDDVTSDGCVYLVMELLEGRTLEDIAAETGGKLPARDVLKAMAELLDALSHAHARGIVHRDIKPDNLFRTTTGPLKVLDFGIARLLESELSLSVTQTGSPMGTPAFMSPEQARGRSKTVDAQSDIYSVGATMFTLLSGELVHGKDITISEYVAATFSTPARSLARVAPELPVPVVSVVDRALKLEKSERWPSAAEMRAALLEAHAAVFGESLPPISIPPPRVSRNSLVSMRDLKSLTPVSTPPRSGPVATVPPPAEEPPPPSRSRARTIAVVAGFVVAGAAALIGVRVAGNMHHAAPRAAAPPPTNTAASAPPTVEATAAPAPTVTAEAPATFVPTEPAPRSTSRHHHATKASAKSAPVAAPPASAAPSAAPSASSTAPAVNVYDRRY